jgi:hypothetical protein
VFSSVYKKGCLTVAVNRFVNDPQFLYRADDLFCEPQLLLASKQQYLSGFLSRLEKSSYCAWGRMFTKHVVLLGFEKPQAQKK